jgi:hypothetical protein
MKTACIITLTLTTLILPTQAEDFVQKQGDTMTGTLTLQAQDGIIPALEIQGQTDQWKFFRLRNTQDDSLWDITMDQESNGLSFWYAAPGTEAIHLSIDTNGIIYGNGAGLTNLNVLEADGSIAYYHADELGSTIALTDSSGTLTDEFAYLPYGAVNRTETTQTPCFIGFKNKNEKKCAFE